MKIRIQPPNARCGWRALSGISLSILMLAGCGGGSSGGGADFGKALVATPQVQPATEGAAPRATEQAAERERLAEERVAARMGVAVRRRNE